MAIIKEDDFDELYKPQQNHLDDNASWSGTLYETFDKELEYIIFVHSKTPKRVWTLTEGDEGIVIVAGFHWVNRLGYFITEKEWENEFDEVPQEGVDE